MIRPSVAFVLILAAGTLSVFAQSPSDSLTITFRIHKPPSPAQFLPGQFNNWGPNIGGFIADTAVSKMTYFGSTYGWIKTYTFKIHDPSDPNRTLGDSAYQYKFNEGGLNSGWYPDPLNPEQNPNDNNNSVLRMSRFFWFQMYPHESGDNYTGFTVGLPHANSDSVTSITFETGFTEEDSVTSQDVTGNYDRTRRILAFTLGSPIPKSNYFKFTARNDKGDSVAYRRISYNVKNVPMPAGTRHGVTLPSLIGDSVYFRLFIPGQSLVLLRIAPQGALPSSYDPIVLHKNITSNDWWRAVKLDSNATYEYYYELADGTKSHDPWGRQTGTHGTRFSTGSAGLAADDYAWNSVSYQRPSLNELVIYELNVAEISGTHPSNNPQGPGTFHDLIKILPHFNSLGVNAIELMPVNDYGNIGASGFSWGYDISHHFALEPSYGSPADFKELVDSAHARGIAVIMDVVFNHLNDPGPLWSMLPDPDANPYFKYPPVAAPGFPTDPRHNEDGLVFFRDMDHFNTITQDYVYEVLKMWIDEYRVDGFRYDYTQGIGWDTSQADMGILGWANRIAAEYGDSVYQIAEHLPESPALIYYSGLTGGWHDSFRDELFEEAKFQNRTIASLQNLVLGLGAYAGNDVPSLPSTYANRTEPVNATVTHDEQSVVYELTTFHNKPEAVALIRDKLVGGLMFTSLGVPMFWQGMEFGESRGWPNDGVKLSYRPVDWSRQNLPQATAHFKYYKTLAHQRRYNPALARGEQVHLAIYDDADHRALVWGFSDSLSSAQVVVLANLDDYPDTLTNIPWLGNGTWYDIFTQDPLEVSGSTVPSMLLSAYSLKIFSNKNDSTLGIPVSVSGDGSLPPGEFALLPAFPNPFNPSVNIMFSVPAQSRVSIWIYNLLGQPVAQVADDEFPAGTHLVRWYGVDSRGRGLPTGVYFARMQSGAFSQVHKLLLLR